MSSLLDYLRKKESEVNSWPSWKRDSLKAAFQIPKFINDDKMYSYLGEQGSLKNSILQNTNSSNVR